MVQINGVGGWGAGGGRNVEDRGKVQKRNLFTVMKVKRKGVDERGKKRKEMEVRGRTWKEEE